MEELNINKMTDQERYEYLLNAITKNEEIWLLQARPGLFAMFEDGGGQEYIPVWPTEDLANSYSEGDWKDYQSEPMGLAELYEWCVELKEDNVLIAAFPNNDSQAIPVNPDDFALHVRESRRSGGSK
jgi:hypothetical protein